MTLSLAYLRTCSAHTGYQIGPLEKVVRLGEFAADLFRHPFLGELRPELLFSEGSVECRLIADHPAIGWKLANVRSHLEKKEKRKDPPV